MEKEFWEACHANDVEEAKKILDNNPCLDVNWVNYQNGQGANANALRQACCDGHDKIVALLLAHPDIDVNMCYGSGRWTPFSGACCHGRASCVRLLLEDRRVDTDKADCDGRTPLWWAITKNSLSVIEQWIASGKEMDLAGPRNLTKMAIEIKRRYDVVPLLERFKKNPEKTRHTTRVQLGAYNELSAELFAMVIFVSDGLLEIKQGNQAARFFSVAKRLPLELQMILCHCAVGSAKEIVHGKYSEVAFRDLAKKL